MADANEVKRVRALKKGLFTKAQKGLLRVIEKESDIEIIESSTPWAKQMANDFKQLGEAYEVTEWSSEALEAGTEARRVGAEAEGRQAGT